MMPSIAAPMQSTRRSQADGWNANTQSRVLILGAGYTTGNRGVAALASGTINAVLQRWPAARITLLDYGRQPARYNVRHSTGTTDVELVNLRFSWRLWLPNCIVILLMLAAAIRCMPNRNLRAKLRDENRYLSDIQRAQLVLSLAGGDSFSDIYGLSRLVYVTLPQLLVLLLEMPLVQLPQTYGPFGSRASRLIAQSVLRRSTKIMARDLEGIALVEALVPSARARLAFNPDMAFALEPLRPSSLPEVFRVRNGCPIVGINISGLLYLGGYTQNNMFNLAVDYRDASQAIVEFFLNKCNCHVLLVPHAYLPGNLSESDTNACEDLLHRLGDQYSGRLHYLNNGYGESETKFVIGLCDFFVGSRMHACIAALSQEVPAVAIAYSKKFIGIWRALGIGDLVMDLRETNDDLLIARLESLYRDRTRVRARLNELIPQVRARALRTFDGLALAAHAPAHRSETRVAEGL